MATIVLCAEIEIGGVRYTHHYGIPARSWAVADGHTREAFRESAREGLAQHLAETLPVTITVLDVAVPVPNPARAPGDAPGGRQTPPEGRTDAGTAPDTHDGAAGPSAGHGGTR